MNDDRDAALRERFASLRQHDAATAPSFHDVLARGAAHRRGHRGLALAAGALAVVAALVFVRLWSPSGASLDLADATLPPWPTQTDSLLKRTGADDLQPAWLRLPTSRLGGVSLDPPRKKP